MIRLLQATTRRVRSHAFTVSASLTLLLALTSCSGEPPVAGEPTAVETPARALSARMAPRAEATNALSPQLATPSQILFGDLHVHTTFSSDAFLLSLPMMGGSGAHPPADACDFARFCSALDFWSINDHAEGSSPRLWSETIDAIEQCNAVTSDAANPDTVAFLGWEWTQVGTSPDDHYGHKNVVLLDTARDRVPARPIAAPRGEFRAPLMPLAGRILLPLTNFSERQRYFDYQAYGEELAATPICESGVDTRELPLDCHEEAATPRDLYRKLDQWDVTALVIPHGTSWGLMTPPGFSLSMELARGQHDPERQRLFEIYSGHGSAEEHRPHRAAELREQGDAICPDPTEEFLACCWRAGEIIEERCEDSSSAECQQNVREARRNYLAAGTSGHNTIPGASVEDWQDCDQCRDCFVPAYSHRPGGSAQYALAVTEPGAPSGADRYRFGLIGSSDTHDARAGNGFKEFARLENTEAPFVQGLSARMMQDRREPVARSEKVVQSEVPLRARRYTERGASFLTTAGLVAVHAAGRDRQSIWHALAERRVYGTSGDRILLFFDLLNPPDGAPRPMGSEVRGMASPPRFRAAAAGALEQRPGCPEHVLQALGPERLEGLCLGECHHPGEQRKRITRIEVVRITAALASGEPVDDLIEDPWRVLPCPDDPAGCTVEFEDAEHTADGRETLYYVRAIQEPTPAVNAGGLRCRYDESGRCVELDPCYGDARTSRDDDCLTDAEERAWSSPIFLRPASS